MSRPAAPFLAELARLFRVEADGYFYGEPLDPEGFETARDHVEAARLFDVSDALYQRAESEAA